MKLFILGMMLGSVLTALGVGAADLYDRNGNVQAPRGSAQSYDYFRQRQLFLDTQALRQQAESDRLNSLTNPCGR
jgi:hypothetical protein